MDGRKLCRVCLKPFGNTHCITLFSNASSEQNLAGRLSVILRVLIEKKCDLPAYICRSCKHTVLALDAKLEAFRSMAKASLETCLASTAPSSSPKLIDETSRKRVKSTSGAEALVSPHTADVRPKSKRAAGRRLFPVDLETRKL